jgi:pimeloyl-ACP methyl ester carboxylesterase
MLDDWDPAFLDVLAEERDVVVFDSAGVGASSGTVSPTVAGMADAAFDFLSAVDLSEVDLLGWSMGGFIAQRMALERPELVRRLIIAGSKPGLVPDAPAPTPEVGQVAGKAMNDIEDFLYLFFPETVKGAKLAWRRWLAFRGPPKRLG